MTAAPAITSKQDALCSELRGAAALIVRGAESVESLFVERGQTEQAGEAERIVQAGKDLLKAVDQLYMLMQRGKSFAPIRHNIRNTIGLVIGFAELLEDEVPRQSAHYRELQGIQSDASLFLQNLDALTAVVVEPIKADSSPVDELIHTLSTKADEGTKATLGRRVLLVDDHDDNRELISMQLNRLGIEVVEARTGNEALVALEEKDVDLVLLDLMLPDINGYDLLTHIKSTPTLRDLSIIMISGVKDEQSAMRCLEAGASDYIVKPINSTLLRARVSSLLEGKAWRDKESAYLSNLEASYDFIRKVLGRYISNDVVQRLLYDGDGLTLGGELREVTILFADIRSFSVISQQISPEDCVRLLNNYFAVMTDVIMSHQGAVDEFIGDGIIATFGAPLSDSEHSDHAVACGLSMQKAMAKVNDYNRNNDLPEIEVGIGINTGPVVVGNIGSELRTKYSVIGHHVNLASRIESCTVGGQVLASARTLAAMKARPQWGKVLEVGVKGSDEPLKIHDLTGIGEPYNIFLPEVEQQFEYLVQPATIEVRLVQGEQLSGNIAVGRLIAISGKDLLIQLEMPLSNMEEVQLRLFGESGEEAVAYARIAGRREGQFYQASLTSLVGNVGKILQQYARKPPA